MSFDAGLVARAFAHANKAKRKGQLDRSFPATKKVFSTEEGRIVRSIQNQVSNDALSASNKTCPECKKPFSIIKLDNIALDACCVCQGIWFDEGELKHFTGFTKDIPADHLRSRTSKYNCPVCSVAMNEHVFIRGHNLLADKCPHGHGVYLERGEFERVSDIS